jgi:hypothetical protein
MMSKLLDQYEQKDNLAQQLEGITKMEVRSTPFIDESVPPDFQPKCKCFNASNRDLSLQHNKRAEHGP